MIEQILNPRSIRRACKAVISIRGSAGVDGMSVKELPAHLKLHRDSIATAIRSGRRGRKADTDLHHAAIQSRLLSGLQTANHDHVAFFRQARAAGCCIRPVIEGKGIGKPFVKRTRHKLDKSSFENDENERILYQEKVINPFSS